MKRNEIQELSLDFAVQIVAFCHELKSKKEFEIGNQLFRSGTSIGANVYEAQGSESRKDFIHKMSIGYKESLESDFWIQVCDRSEFLPDPGDLKNQISSVRKLLGKILSSLHKQDEKKKM